jgi:hypothetical protein
MASSNVASGGKLSNACRIRARIVGSGMINCSALGHGGFLPRLRPVNRRHRPENATVLARARRGEATELGQRLWATVVRDRTAPPLRGRLT